MGNLTERDNLVELGLAGIKRLKWIEWKDVDLIGLAEHRNRWWAFVSMVVHLSFPKQILG